MAKKKSIYDKPLKDINKDGKRNFKDTWVGDLIGADGKAGVQGPGMKASMKGARRGSDAEPKDKPKAKAKDTQPKRRGGAGGHSTKTAPKSSGRGDGKAETARRKADTSRPKRVAKEDKAMSMPVKKGFSAWLKDKTSKKYNLMTPAERTVWKNKYDKLGKAADVKAKARAGRKPFKSWLVDQTSKKYNLMTPAERTVWKNKYNRIDKPAKLHKGGGISKMKQRPLEPNLKDTVLKPGKPKVKPKRKPYGSLKDYKPGKSRRGGKSKPIKLYGTPSKPTRIRYQPTQRSTMRYPDRGR